MTTLKETCRFAMTIARGENADKMLTDLVHMYLVKTAIDTVKEFPLSAEAFTAFMNKLEPKKELKP